MLGRVSYGGAGIYRCTVPGTIALTYDDCPYIYTSYILDLLKSYRSKATFFITANNNGKGEIDDPSTIYPAIIKRMVAEGHQLASHTWTHQDLSKVTSTQRRSQMIKTEMALRNIVGFFPTYMRPPYSSCDAPSGCEADMAALGYHIVCTLLIVFLVGQGLILDSTKDVLRRRHQRLQSRLSKSDSTSQGQFR